MPPRKKSIQKRASIMKNTRKDMELKRDFENENYISSFADTKRIISFLP